MSGAAVERDLLLALLDQAFDRPSWYGTNLSRALRLELEQAAWRPGPKRHNVWELVVHCAYWKYAVWRRFGGATRGSFSLAGSNFFERPVEATAAALRADIRLLEEWHAKLRAAVAAAKPALFDARRQGALHRARVGDRDRGARPLPRRSDPAPKAPARRDGAEPCAWPPEGIGASPFQSVRILARSFFRRTSRVARLRDRQVHRLAQTWVRSRIRLS